MGEADTEVGRKGNEEILSSVHSSLPHIPGKMTGGLCPGRKKSVAKAWLLRNARVLSGPRWAEILLKTNAGWADARECSLLYPIFLQILLEGRWPLMDIQWSHEWWLTILKIFFKCRVFFPKNLKKNPRLEKFLCCIAVLEYLRLSILGLIPIPSFIITRRDKNTPSLYSLHIIGLGSWSPWGKQDYKSRSVETWGAKPP